MTITDHPFTNENAEYDLIKALILEIEKHPDIDNNWEPGRMDGWRYSAHAEKGIDFFSANAHYWKNEVGDAVGLFISEYGRDDFFIVVHPDYWDLFDAVLDWGLKVWAGERTKISTDIYDFGQKKISLLLGAGFHENGHVENVRIYSMAEYDFSYSLKPGFQVMSFPEYGNVESRVNLVRNAFENPNYSEVRLRSIQRSPNYRPELDLVVVSPEGESVAYCMGWLEENNPKVGFIEPMGVHSDFRRNGFGSVLAKVCFQRQTNLGVEQVWIASNAEPDISNFLYDSLHPMTVKRSYRYTLDLT